MVRLLCVVVHVLAILASMQGLQVTCRRASAALSLLGVLGGAPDVTQASGGACTSTTSAISGATVDSCRTVGLVKGSLRGCRANENCFSTSAVAAGKNRPPWTYDGITADNDGATAVKFLLSAVEASGVKVLQNKVIEEEGSSSKYFYILGAERGDDRKEKQPAGSSLFYEFKVLPSEKLVLYRAFVDKTVFLYPLQEPVSDFGALDARLDDIRGRVGWLKVSSD